MWHLDTPSVRQMDSHSNIRRRGHEGWLRMCCCLHTCSRVRFSASARHRDRSHVTGLHCGSRRTRGASLTLFWWRCELAFGAYRSKQCSATHGFRHRGARATVGRRLLPRGGLCRWCL